MPSSSLIRSCLKTRRISSGARSIVAESGSFTCRCASCSRAHGTGVRTDDVAERYDADIWQPGETLPDGVEVAVFEDTETRWREAVFAFPSRAVVVFGDVVEGDGEGGLRMPPEWWPPQEERTGRIRNELGRVLDWPIDVVLVSHGEPVLDDPRLALQRVIAD